MKKPHSAGSHTDKPARREEDEWPEARAETLLVDPRQPADSVDIATTALNYDYEAQGGQPPNGRAYQSQSTLGYLTVSYTDHDANDNTNFLSQVSIGDTVTCNGVTWTVSGVTLRGSNILFQIDPPVNAPPYGLTVFTFGPLAPPSSSDQTLIDQINAAMDIYSQTHGFVGPNARNLLIHLILAEVNGTPGSRHAAKAREAKSHRDSER